jgi:hypothetical protein
MHFDRGRSLERRRSQMALSDHRMGRLNGRTLPFATFLPDLVCAGCRSSLFEQESGSFQPAGGHGYPITSLCGRGHRKRLPGIYQRRGRVSGVHFDGSRSMERRRAQTAFPDNRMSRRSARTDPAIALLADFDRARHRRRMLLPEFRVMKKTRADVRNPLYLVSGCGPGYRFSLP